MPTAIRYISPSQQAIIFKSLKRFEKLKLSYSGLYRKCTICQDSLRALQGQLADTSSVLLQHRQDLKLEKYNGWLYAQNAEKWKHRAHKRNLILFTLLTLFVGYETLHR